MGNPSLRPSTEPPRPAPPSGNGILARIPGDIIANGSKTFPAPGPQHEGERDVVVDVPDIGRVVITYELNSYRHGRSRHYHWRVVRAIASSTPASSE